MAHDFAWSKARLGCAAFAVLVALPAAGQGPTSANGLMTFPNVRIEQGAPVAATAAAPGAGLRAYLDPETGALSDPSAAEVAALQARLPSASRKPGGKALRQFRLAGGRGVGVELDESFLSYTVVRKTGDGRIVEACVQGDELAERLMMLGGPVALPAKGGVQ